MDEQRANPRVDKQNHATLTVESSADAASLEKETFTCLTKDLSVSGLQFSAFVKPPVGTILQIQIAFQRPVRVFSHTVRVAWTRSNDDGTYAVGVEITDTTREILESWETFVTQMLSRDATDSHERDLSPPSA